MGYSVREISCYLCNARDRFAQVPSVRDMHIVRAIDACIEELDHFKDEGEDW